MDLVDLWFWLIALTFTLCGGAALRRGARSRRRRPGPAQPRAAGCCSTSRPRTWTGPRPGCWSGLFGDPRSVLLVTHHADLVDPRWRIVTLDAVSPAPPLGPGWPTQPTSMTGSSSRRTPGVTVDP